SRSDLSTLAAALQKNSILRGHLEKYIQENNLSPIGDQIAKFRTQKEPTWQAEEEALKKKRIGEETRRRETDEKKQLDAEKRKAEEEKQRQAKQQALQQEEENAAKAKAEREQKRKKDKRVRDFSTELFELSLRGQAEKASVSDLKTALQKG